MTQFPGNEFTRRFGLTFPIVQGPMGGVAGAELVAAVANAGGLGILPIWSQSPETAVRRIEQTRALTANAFGVNIRADLVQTDHIKAALDVGVSIIHLFWGDPQESMRRAGLDRTHHAKVLATVGDADAARAALDASAQALIAQGVEAGGHVLSDIPLATLLGEVLDVAADTPVIAAGGLADAEDVARVMAAGAAGALLGTRFVATAESFAHDDYKRALISAGRDSTARSVCFDDGWHDAPHRTLINDTFTAWHDAGEPASGARPGDGDIVIHLNQTPFARYSVMPPVQGMTGDIREGAMYAGTGAAKIHDCPPAARVVADLCELISVS